LITIAISAAMLPGSFGISEWSFSAVFAGFDVPRADTVQFVLANRLLLSSVSIALALIAIAALSTSFLRDRGAIL
jgi:hypothetical protein